MNGRRLYEAYYNGTPPRCRSSSKLQKETKTTDCSPKYSAPAGNQRQSAPGATTLPSAENTQTAGTTRAGSARARPVRQREAQSKHAKPSGLRGAGPCGQPTQSTPTARPSKANEELSPTPAGHCHHQTSNHTTSSQTAPSTRWTRQRQSRVPPQEPHHASPPT